MLNPLELERIQTIDPNPNRKVGSSFTRDFANCKQKYVNHVYEPRGIVSAIPTIQCTMIPEDKKIEFLAVSDRISDPYLLALNEKYGKYIFEKSS